MSDEKSKKPLKLKTFSEIRNDPVYEIHFLPKKRRSPTNKLTVPLANNEDDDDDTEVQVR
jgi:hypothetical protein